MLNPLLPTIEEAPYAVPAAPRRGRGGWRELPPAGRPNGPVPPGRPLNAFALLKSLRTNWKRAAGCGLVVGASLAAFAWIMLPPLKPSAFTKLRLLPPSQDGTNRPPESQIEQRTHKELILSRLVIAKALDMPGIAQLPTIAEKGDRESAIKALKNEVGVDFPSGSEIIRIRYTGDRPEDDVAIVTAVEKSYITEWSGRASASREERYLELKAQRIEAEKRLKKLRDAYNAGTEGGDSKAGTDAQQAQSLAEYNALTYDISGLDREEGNLKSAIALLERRLAAPESAGVSEAVLATALAQDDEYLEASKKVRQLAGQLEIYRKNYEATSPTLAKAEKDIADAQAKVEERRKAARKVLDEQARDKFERETRETLATKMSELKIAQERLDGLRKRQMALKSKLGGRLLLDGKDIVMEQAQNEYSELRRDETKAEFELKAKLGIEELEPATAEIPNDRNRRTQVSGLAFAAGFGAVLLLFSFLEFRARRIGGAEDVTADIGLRLVGSVPRCPSKELVERGLSGNPTPNDLHWDTVLKESADSARTILLHAARADGIKVLLVTSAVAGEGKSSVARTLAQSLARSGRHTLLIDGDLRKPTLHALYNAPMTPGLCEALRGEIAFGEAVRQSRTPNLEFLPAGRVERLAIEQLAQDGLGRLLAEARDRFEFVILDSSPILPVADGMLMARHADGVLFSLFAHVSQVERVTAACQRLAQLEVPVIGAIVSGTREETYGYGSGHYRAGI